MVHSRNYLCAVYSNKYTIHTLVNTAQGQQTTHAKYGCYIIVQLEFVIIIVVVMADFNVYDKFIFIYLSLVAVIIYIIYWICNKYWEMFKLMLLYAIDWSMGG